MSTKISKAALLKWLKENEKFTNEFVCDWVEHHPELHLALFKNNPSFTPYEVALPNPILDPLDSRDSGVDVAVQGYRIKSELSLEKGVLSLQISASTKLQDEPKKKAPEVNPETLRAERIEAMLDMSGYLHARLFAPHDIIKKVMHSAQLFMKCTVVNLLLNEALPFLDPSEDEVQFAKAFVVSTKYEFETPRKVQDGCLPYLIALTEQTEKAGTAFEVDTETNTICLILRSTWGTTVGYVVMTYTEDELIQISDLDLVYLEFFSHICGMAIDNAIAVIAMKKYTSELMCEVFPEQIPESTSQDSISSTAETASTTCSTDDGGYGITRTYSCPDLTNAQKPIHQTL